MSCEVVSVTYYTYQTISVAVGAGAGAAVAPAAVGLGFAYGAVLAAQKLRADYQEALCELSRRQAELELNEKLWVAEHTHLAKAVLAMADTVSATGAGSAAEFVGSGLQEIVRLSSEPRLESIRERAVSLIDQLKTHAKPEDFVKETIALTGELHTALNKLAAGGKIKPDVALMLTAIREEISAVRSEAERSPLVAQLEKLEALPPEESKVALQGIGNLKDRTGKILQTQIASEQTKLRRREIAAESVAMLQALSRVPDAAEASEAIKILEQISRAFATETAPSVSTLEGFLNKAKALFESCEARLQKAAASAYVADTVAETLMEMGYSVSPVPEEGAEACMIRLDQSTGMLVTMDAGGQLKTEMVAYDESSREPDMESQERVCSLVDDIFVALRKKDIQVKEKFRKTMKHGKLKLVEKPLQEAPQQESRPKERVLS